MAASHHHVLDLHDASEKRSLFLLSSARPLIQLVYALNERLHWGLSRQPKDHVCYRDDFKSWHVYFAAAREHQSWHLIENVPHRSEWLEGKAPSAVGGLFEALPPTPPLRPLMRKPNNVHAILTLPESLSEAEIVNLAQACQAIPWVMSCQPLPWDSFRERHNLMFEPPK